VKHNTLENLCSEMKWAHRQGVQASLSPFCPSRLFATPLILTPLGTCFHLLLVWLQIKTYLIKSGTMAEEEAPDKPSVICLIVHVGSHIVTPNPDALVYLTMQLGSEKFKCVGLLI
jgi:hypothetical protein